ncbi:DUF6341 family protein [Kriegella aquimaris]|uniref:Uracil phosphoribosyltransferase n=1 Tax=Kriegella aquimaris TaxID=192904 RepID=A0A1G9QIK1_9FLAO|nr:uracil phosphoribosyltransferase [Kriegella aquimaris]SDM10700.1 hypothetical protein SAMN04488514_10554 [Kriegella aquimaris]
MKAFFEGIQDLFVNYLFAPYDFFRFMDNWWTANIVNWILFIVVAVAFVYWMLQLKQYNDNGEEDKSISSHSYL